jgi:calcium/calmodulin-dependent protein kinase (CaM kinase) II
MAEAVTDELLRLNQQLLDSIGRGDWDVYQSLCDTSLTAFEPEALGQLVEGLGFHHYYFQLGRFRGNHQTTMCSPRVRVLGDVAVVTYIRLDQRLGDDGSPVTTGCDETRVWQRQAGGWKHVHFHRSPLPS